MIKGRFVVAPFSFDDSSGLKVRPTLCLTEPIGPYGHVVLAFVSTQIPGRLLESDLLIAASSPDFQATRLKVTSVIRLNHLNTIKDTRILRQLGRVSPALQAQVEQKLVKLFGL